MFAAIDLEHFSREEEKGFLTPIFSLKTDL